MYKLFARLITGSLTNETSIAWFVLVNFSLPVYIISIEVYEAFEQIYCQVYFSFIFAFFAAT